nr:hypothetical protein CFP56_42077 [Quercus suber]
MSSDLFAAFGSVQSTEEETNAVQKSRRIPEPSAALQHVGFSNPNNPGVDGDDDDDDFGDFEDASASTTTAHMEAQKAPRPAEMIASSPVKKKPLPFFSPPPKHKSHELGRHPFADHMDILFSADDDNDDYNAGADEMTDLATNPQAAMEYSKRIIAQQQAEQEAQGRAQTALDPHNVSSRFVQSSHQRNSSETKDQSKPAKAPRDPNVLFDADDPSDSGDDDFGDFEASDEPSSLQTKPATSHDLKFNLLSLDEEQTKLPPDPLTNRSQQFSPNPESKNNAPHESHLDIFNSDAWDDFEDCQPTIDRSISTVPPASEPPRPVAAPIPTITKSHNSDLPPTNVPPPSILLSIFPSLFTQANEALLVPFSKASASDRLVLISHPASQKFLSRHLAVTIVLGHIIAGRKLRWKRDHYLAQGMRIGPAAAGGKSGMKLAGVDRSELAKEDREVLDAVRLWKAQVGKIRNATTALNAAKTNKLQTKLTNIPEIAETLPVKVLKAIEGGFTAPHACALCGLRREERVLKVDVDVDDSFGEWWVNNVSMHLTCRNFWQEHEGLLRSR